MNVFFDPLITRFWEGRFGAGWCEPGRCLYDCELVYVSRGACAVKTESGEFRLTAGDWLIIPPRFWHETILAQPTFRHCVHFDWTRDFVDKISPLQVAERRLYVPRLEHPVPPEIRAALPFFAHADAEQRRRLEFLWQALRRRAPDAALELWAVLRAAFTAPCPVPRGKSARAALTVKMLIENEYARPLTYADFCAATGLTRSHLCDIFRRQIGVSPTAYLNHARLTQAERLLSEGKLNIAETARACGIPDANYFARLFKRKNGVAPGAFGGKARIASPARRGAVQLLGLNSPPSSTPYFFRHSSNE